MRQRCEPLAEKSLDLLFVETLGDALRRRRVRTTQQPVVERLELDAASGQLFVEILVPVDAKPSRQARGPELVEGLARVGKVGAKLDEERPEVFIHAVEVIVVDHGA